MIMFDVNACGIASGLSDEEKMCMIAGTWSINEFIAKKPVLNGTVALNSMFCIPGYYLIEESSPTSAGNMEWFIRNLMNYEKAEAKEAGGSVYDITNEWVESIEPQDNGIIFLPFLNGSNEDALAKGTFIGLTAYHNKKHMLRAVYEGIVFSHITHVKKLLRNREVPACIAVLFLPAGILSFRIFSMALFRQGDKIIGIYKSFAYLLMYLITPQAHHLPFHAPDPRGKSPPFGYPSNKYPQIPGAFV